jgi:uncharacterized membrane protein YkoI
MKYMPGILLLIFMAMIRPAAAGGDAKSVTFASLPAPVQNTITNQVADGRLGTIEQTNDSGQTNYDVTFTPKGGDERDFTVADDGTLLSLEMFYSELPAAVQKTIEVQANGWKLEGVDKNAAEAEVSYDVEVSTNSDAGAQSRDFTVAEDGDLLSTSVLLTNTPAAVQATIKSQMANGSVESLDETFDPDDGNQFDVTVLTRGGGEKSFTVTEAGEMFSEDVALDKVSPGARKTIQEKVGNGRLLRIEKSLVEKKDGVLPYHVECRKDGQEYDFSVGPRGRFLGTDE